MALVTASPDSLALAKQNRIQPRQLLGADAADKAALERLYKAALDGKPVDAEERSMLEDNKGTAGGASIQEHVQRIVARVRSRNILVLQWAAVTLIMFNVGGSSACMPSPE